MSQAVSEPVPVLPDQASLSQADAGLQPPQGGSPASAPPPPVPLAEVAWKVRELKPANEAGGPGQTVRFHAAADMASRQEWHRQVSDAVATALKAEALRRLAREPNDLARYQAARKGLVNIDQELKSLNQQESDINLHRQGLLGMPDSGTAERLESLDALMTDLRGRIKRLQTTRAACEKVIQDLLGWSVQEVATSRNIVSGVLSDRYLEAKAALARAASRALSDLVRVYLEIAAVGSSAGDLRRKAMDLLDEAAANLEGGE